MKQKKIDQSKPITDGYTQSPEVKVICRRIAGLFVISEEYSNYLDAVVEAKRQISDDAYEYNKRFAKHLEGLILGI